MKKIYTLIILLFTIVCSAQKEGQGFCEGDIVGEYFPLTIEKKKIFWADTYYIETMEGKKIINEKTYHVFKQTWKDGNSDLLYLRKDNDAVVQYKQNTNKEVLRFNEFFNEGKSWIDTSVKGKYTVVSYAGELLTPYCSYKNLMILKAEFEKLTFLFYYQKGYGYIGATLEGRLISYVTPEI